MLRSRLFAICNSIDKTQMKFPIETALRDMANTCQGAYILAVLDACRREIPKEMQESPKQSPCRGALSFGRESAMAAAAAMRGSGDEREAEDPTISYKGNLVMVYACEPDKRSAAQSSVAGQVFK